MTGLLIDHAHTRGVGGPNMHHGLLPMSPCIINTMLGMASACLCGGVCWRGA